MPTELTAGYANETAELGEPPELGPPPALVPPPSAERVHDAPEPDPPSPGGAPDTSELDGKTDPASAAPPSDVDALPSDGDALLRFKASHEALEELRWGPACVALDEPAARLAEFDELAGTTEPDPPSSGRAPEAAELAPPPSTAAGYPAATPLDPPSAAAGCS